jgi:hypothetical protein
MPLRILNIYTVYIFFNFELFKLFFNKTLFLNLDDPFKNDIL